MKINDSHGGDACGWKEGKAPPAAQAGQCVAYGEVQFPCMRYKTEEECHQRGALCRWKPTVDNLAAAPSALMGETVLV